MRRNTLLLAVVLALVANVSTAIAQVSPAPLTIRAVPYLTGFSLPVHITSSKDGTKRLFVVQQRGLIRVINRTTLGVSDFINLSDRVSTSGSERGLLGLAFHPQFATNSYFFVNYTRNSDGATIVSRFTAINGNTVGDPTSEVILLTIAQPFSNHNGGMIAFGPDGNLYIGMGDGGSANDPGNRSQNINESLGKMLRITPSTAAVPTPPGYTIPPTNPYAGATPGVDEIYAIGLRNPWRFSFDRGGTNQLWLGDVGQDAVEEVDVITLGANYGWRVYEGNTCTGLDPTACVPANYTAPIYTYANAGSRCSVTGGYVYRGMQNNFVNGSYIYADYCTGEIFVNASNSTPLLDTPRLLSSFGEDDEGELYMTGLTSGTVDKLVRVRSSSDFDGDLRSELSVFRPSTGVWYSYNVQAGAVKIQQFGLNGDTPVAKDYDGDNITDVAVFRPSTNVWYTYRSSDSTVSVIPFGSAGDVVAPGDYDGDARADQAIFRPSTGTWWIRRSTNPNSFLAVPFGLNGDIPAAGDYDGDGLFDISVFRPSNGVWYRLNSINNSFVAVAFGLNGDIPTQGDFDGDGRNDQAVFRPSTGIWYMNRSTSGFLAQQFGLNGDIPAVGDYDGDSRDDVAVFRPSNGVWYLSRSTAGIFIAPFGLTGDIPTQVNDVP
ncbi:MAG: PQQ-dependent sugar dehydrogenase [Blastocatellia bacterium]|nr:PQQ-dependent sugar dehydrogenase [Blastocatellia bacterium]